MLWYTHPYATAVVHRLGQKPSGCRQDIHKKTCVCIQTKKGYASSCTCPAGVFHQHKDVPEPTHGWSSPANCGPRLGHLSIWTGRGNRWRVGLRWQTNKLSERKKVSNEIHCLIACLWYPPWVSVLPPVSLSSTRISSFSSLQGISGSSPITVKVASNSPSTRNLTRPLATQIKTQSYS